jgi:hypothetical protein
MLNPSSQCSVTQESKWILILDWPGLDKIHPFRTTRCMSAETIMAQFRDHALRCPSCMDKVLYALKNRTLGYDMDCNFFLETIMRYLQSPESFTIMEWVSIEDFMLNECCQNLLVNILNAHSDNIQGEFNKEELKRSILQEFGRRRKHWIDQESYLNMSFSEDVLRSQVELFKVIRRMRYYITV